MIKRMQKGFTLLEVLVALAIGASALGIAIAWTGELLLRQSDLIDHARLALTAQSAVEEWRTGSLQAAKREPSEASSPIEIRTSRLTESSRTRPIMHLAVEQGRFVVGQPDSTRAFQLDAIRLGRAAE
ncbi:prepilin-type N-terminal cleavage/methylation domain-containing protein [Nitrogeniibacter mangrovi]|uniref:Prepilin-type N-terminal cleavage/methylation domain-containing protein n=1 Tax=Nitrogeniibacter mangrovi TaxID=2016596 RepID=A0A6C1B6R6_9RHOO|nr:prepilin-type N-terminal cleavage/methylation domain-containing protein [Nitrogeniibacter mangrovi]QID19391.1 prepilin-type N-terminal cleavage/methylation domain-containing protein [Nitrogeniibacter mangrovi]